MSTIVLAVLTTLAAGLGWAKVATVSLAAATSFVASATLISNASVKWKAYRIAEIEVERIGLELELEGAKADDALKDLIKALAVHTDGYITAVKDLSVLGDDDDEDDDDGVEDNGDATTNGQRSTEDT